MAGQKRDARLHAGCPGPPGCDGRPRRRAHIGILFSDLVVPGRLAFFGASPDPIIAFFEIPLPPPPAAAARLDSVPLPLPEKKSSDRTAPARADHPFKGIALILLSTVFLGTSDVTAKY